jgi:hypothetical protein
VEPSSSDYEQELDRAAAARGVRGSLAVVAQHATAFEPSGRYQSAEQLADAVRKALELGSDASASSRAALVPASSDEDDVVLGAAGDARYSGGVRERQQGQRKQAAGGPLRSLWGRVAGPRRPSDTPFLLRLVDLVVLLGSMLLIGLLISLGRDSLSGIVKPWSTVEYVIALAVFIGVTGLWVETHRAVSLWGPYEGASHRYLLYFRRLLIFEVITFGTMVVVATVLPQF